MLFRTLFRDEQKKYQINRAIIRGIKRHRFSQAVEHARHLAQAFKAAMRDAYALSQARRAQVLAHLHAIQYLFGAEVETCTECFGSQQEQSVLGDWLSGQHDGVRREELSDSVH